MVHALICVPMILVVVKGDGVPMQDVHPTAMTQTARVAPSGIALALTYAYKSVVMMTTASLPRYLHVYVILRWALQIYMYSINRKGFM